MLAPKVMGSHCTRGHRVQLVLGLGWVGLGLFSVTTCKFATPSASVDEMLHPQIMHCIHSVLYKGMGLHPYGCTLWLDLVQV